MIRNVDMNRSIWPPSLACEKANVSIESGSLFVNRLLRHVWTIILLGAMYRFFPFTPFFPNTQNFPLRYYYGSRRFECGAMLLRIHVNPESGAKTMNKLYQFIVRKPMILVMVW